MKVTDLTGQKFNRLTVMKYIGKDKCGNSQWLCLCDCGNKTIVTSGHLKNGHSKSCGCFKNEKLIQRNKTDRHLYKNRWTKEEINILKQFYPNNGIIYCCNLLNRTKPSVAGKVAKLNLSTTITTFSLPRKNIIKKISNSRVLSLCQIHGETIHYCRKNKIIYCLKCHHKNPVANFAYRFRALIMGSIKKMSNSNYIPRGGFRNMNYTPLQLYNYLMNIKRLQKNKCPHCSISYDKCTMSIDHVIPLKTAKTEQEVIDLFCLQNLNLMCKSCNSSKNDKDYNIWMKSKSV
jgi:hypothetical protein